jgi:hypothetical protein
VSEDGAVNDELVNAGAVNDVLVSDTSGHRRYWTDVPSEFRDMTIDVAYATARERLGPEWDFRGVEPDLHHTWTFPADGGRGTPSPLPGWTARAWRADWLAGFIQCWAESPGDAIGGLIRALDQSKSA